VEKRPEISAEYFDEWYADMARPHNETAPHDGIAPHDEITQRHLGLPASLLSTSLLSWDGIADVVEALRLPAGGTLLDLACGRGGYGLEIAARTGARLIGVDYSAEAIRQATANPKASGTSARFEVGDLAATGLPSASVDGIVCVDAIGFATDQAAAYAELRRVLVSGGRVVLTCWEPLDRGDPRLSDGMRAVDTQQGLLDAGFIDVEVRDRPAWRASERGMWEEAAHLDPGEDPALQSFHDEAVHMLDRFDLVRRVMATGTAP
jgi:SAM-dependent methyltransferase